jgi:hypothetical protein
MVWIEKAVANWAHWNFSSWLSGSMPERTLGRFPADQDAFDVQFLEDLLVRLPDQPELLVQLGQLYTHMGRYREGLAVDRRLVALKPRDPVAYYNLACSHALLKQSVHGFAALRRSIELGFRDIEHMQVDPDLGHLRKDPRWSDLLSVVKL